VGGEGSVINEGDIFAEKVFLIGRQVANSGSISCPAGYVVMASGDRVFLGEPGSDIVLEIDGPSLPESADPIEGSGVLNEGTVEAAGGTIILAAAGDIYSQAISNVGSLSVSNDTGNAGEIKLTAADGDVTNTGTIEASGSEGGQITMEGTRVGQFGTIHADGTDSHGGSVDLTASEVVALSSDSLTTANAGLNGNGGEVIAYSPDTALFWADARIEAKGGSESGDGGFVEVSGTEQVLIRGWVDASATNGAAGNFLIDPTDIQIVDVDSGTADLVDPAAGDPRLFTTNANTNEITDETIEGLLDIGTSVTLDTSNHVGGPYVGTGDITQEAAAQINKTAGGAATLTLIAENDIDLDGGIISTTGTLEVVLTATGNVDIDAAVTTNGGNFTSSGTTFDNTVGAITTSGGNVDLTGHTGAVDIDAAIDASGGAGTGSIDISGASITVGDNLTAGAGITFNAAVTADGAGAQTFDAGAGTLTAKGISKAASDLTLGGATGIDISGDLSAVGLTLEDDVTASGAGSQEFDAEGGTLTAMSISKAVGDLTLGGATGIDISGDLSAVGLTLEDDVTASGAGSQEFDAEGGLPRRQVI
jgi:hypothetical protein